MVARIRPLSGSNEESHALFPLYPEVENGPRSRTEEERRRGGGLWDTASALSLPSVSASASACSASAASLENRPAASSLATAALEGGDGRQRTFDYDAVFGPESSQGEVYARTVGDAVRRNIFRGFNTTILAYGQTGSGKTFTMDGPEGEGGAADEGRGGEDDVVGTAPGRDESGAFPVSPALVWRKRKKSGGGRSGSAADGSADDREEQEREGEDEDVDDEGRPFEISEKDGIIPRAVHDLFRAKRLSTASDVTVSATFLEIYNDEIFDLLSPGSPTSSGAGGWSSDAGAKRERGAGLQLSDYGSDGVIVRGLTSVPVSGPRHVRRLMRLASARRTTGITRMNAQSSRSHAVCALSVTARPAVRRGATSGRLGTMTSTDVITAKLTLVDLAGSERLKRTGGEGLTKQESININNDLFVLGKVVSALADRSKGEGSVPSHIHIPYRDCKLTRILRDSLGGES